MQNLAELDTNSFIVDLSAAHAHRAAYVALLKTLVPHGMRRDFARSLDITPVYFSNLLSLNDRRMPHPDLVQRMINSVSASAELRQALKFHIEEARRARSAAKTRIRSDLRQQSPGDLLKNLQVAHHEAVFATDPQISGARYQIVLQGSQLLLDLVDPSRFPMTYSEVCMLGSAVGASEFVGEVRQPHTVLRDRQAVSRKRAPPADSSKATVTKTR